MEEVNLHIGIAQDGSGYSLSQDENTRTAYIWRYPSETYHGTGHIMILPLNEQEEDAFSDRNVIEKNGIKGLKVTNVKERYFEE
jgi:hypothetical protein